MKIMNLVNLKESDNYPILQRILSKWKVFVTSMLFCSLSLSVSAAGADVVNSTQIANAAQQNNGITVSGVILDENNEPVIGANIVVVGTTNGTITDLNGKWTLNVPRGSSLSISYIGYLTQTIKPTGSKKIVTVLKPENKALDEIVVIGFGSVKKSNLTGSVSKISEESVKDRPIATLGEAFQGQLAGVSSSASGGGLPGSELSIRIRGINTINGKSNPLYVIDGVPRDNMSDINPSDIASIQVLKDASSTAIYGSRGASGVILIETKQGKGKPSVTFDAYYGFQNAERKMNLMDGPEYVAHQIYIRNVNHLREGGSMSDPMSARKAANRIPDWWLTTDKFTNWQDEVLRLAPIQSYQASASAKSDMGSIFLSAGYMDQKGIVVGTDYTKTNARLNSSLNISKDFKIGLNIGISRSVQNMGGGGGKESPLHHALMMSPLIGINEATRDMGMPSSTEVGEVFPNPLLRLQNTLDQNEYTRLNASLWGEYTIMDGLTFKTMYSNTYDARKYEYFLPGNLNSNGYKSSGDSNSFRTDNWTLQNTLTYDKTFAKKHSVNLLLGQSAEKQNYFDIVAAATGWPYENLTTLNLASTPTTATTSRNAYANASFFGRASYNYAEKYLITASVRRDGSSRFGRNNKWGTFPSFSAGWKINEEAFMKSVDWISLLKLRAAWGKAGNDNMGSNYPSVAALGTYNTTWNGALVAGAAPSNMPNPDLQWEATKSLNFGIDFSAFNNRLQLNVDYYINNTENLLFSMPVPYTTGFSSFTTNIGSVRNSGIEVDITSYNINKGSFKWSTNLNISHNKNEVTNMGGQQVMNVTNWRQQYRTEIGKPLSQYIAYKSNGLLTKDCFDVNGKAIVPILAGQEEGNVRYVDQNNDGKITSEDMVVCGNNFPDLTYGFTNRFSYKNLELSVLLQGQVGGEILYIGARHNDNGNSTRNTYKHWLHGYKIDYEAKYGAGENPLPLEYMKEHGIDMSWDGETPNDFGQSGGGMVDDRRIYSASYLRIKNITLSYTLPKRLLQNTLLKSGRIYGSVDNVYTFTDYPGFTPESDTNGNGTTVIGSDYSTYPLSRRFIVGVNLVF